MSAVEVVETSFQTVGRLSVVMTRWREDHYADGDECHNALLVTGITWHGKPVTYGNAELRWEGPTDFLTIWISVSQKFFDSLSLDDYLMGSTVDKCGFLVTEFKVEP